MARKTKKVRADETDSDLHDSATDADLESDSCDAAFRAHEVAPFIKRVHIHVHHVRKRLADMDGLSVKAVIDSLVEIGVLHGDSPEQVASVTHTQSKGQPETTTFTITEV